MCLSLIWTRGKKRLSRQYMARKSLVKDSLSLVCVFGAMTHARSGKELKTCKQRRTRERPQQTINSRAMGRIITF